MSSEEVEVVPGVFVNQFAAYPRGRKVQITFAPQGRDYAQLTVNECAVLGLHLLAESARIRGTKPSTEHAYGRRPAVPDAVPEEPV